MKPARILACCLLAPALILAGCALFSSPVEAQRKAEGKVETSDKALVTEAQKETRTAKEAAEKLPPSRPADIVKDATGRADALLAQANGPLPAQESSRITALVAGLLSEERAARAAAEKQLAASRATADERAAENTALKDELRKAGDTLRAWAVERDETAKKWERMWLWIYCAAGLYAASVALPLLSSVFPGLAGVSKLAGYIAAPAIQFAKDRAVGGLMKVGHALEDFRQDAPQFAAKLTRTFDSHTDADHQRVIGGAARDYKATLPPTVRAA